ncbi:MAG: EAL domain-containing protein [Desulfovermiculus sp.]
MTTGSPNQSSFAERLLELMPDALVIIDEQQRIVHVNTQAERLFLESASNILQQPLDVLLPQELAHKHHHYVQSFKHSHEKVRMLEDRSVLSARRSNGESFSFLGTIARLNYPDGLRLAIIMREVTDYLRSEHLRQRMERALYCLSQCLSAVIHASEEQALLEQVCRIAVNTGGYRFAWIGYAEEDEKKRVRPMAAAGQDEGYLQEVFVSWSETDPSGNGPIGRAIRTGSPQFSRNIEEDRDFLPWQEPALLRGFHSVAAYPLRMNSQILGALTFYSHEDTFDQEETDLLTRLADNLSFGLTALRTQKERDEQQAEKRKLAGALEQTADAVVITDREGIIEYVNPSFESSTGFSRQEAIGQKPNILKSGEHPPEFYQHMWETILRGEVYRDTIINKTKDGSLYYVYKTITPLYDHQGRLTHFLATGKDLTEQLQTKSRLQYLISHDPITGLMNHKEFVRELDQTIAELSDTNQHLAILVLGLDNFKAINEFLGRSTGDRILKQTGQRLAHQADLAVARLESDKFGVMIQGFAPQQTGVLVDSFLSAIAQPIKLDPENEEVVITATAGISCHPFDGSQGVSLVQKADTAMFRAKESGIQRFEFYTPDMQASSLERLRLNKELLEALEQSQFTLYFQPQIELATGVISGAEALVRWLHPGGQVIGPQEFIPVLEEMGRIGELGDFVLGQACATLQRIRQAGLVLPQMAINLAAPQLEDPALSSKIEAALNRAGISADRLELEVTESLLISRYDNAQDRLKELLDLGIGVALDDFGTGYSSLQYLTRYPFSKLKIDKSFVWKMGEGEKEYEVVKAIISLGRSLNIKVLAEGVENEEHVRSLRDLGCEAVQGYLYSPPVDEEKFRAYLRTQSGR